ncbi:MAG: hypothetical protein RLZ12_1045 [Bacillota bacterium]|jgi:fumarate hydratase class I
MELEKVLSASIYKLIVRTVTTLPFDVEKCLEEANFKYEGDKSALQIILHNNMRARQKHVPLCQDTGVLTFYVQAPCGFSQKSFINATKDAVAKATENSLLRQNTIDILTTKMRDDNLGRGMPIVHFIEREQAEIQVSLLMKGGGCENKNKQYSLPYDMGTSGIAERDWEGVRQVVLHGVHEAQGAGCAPGIVGVAVGGDQASGAALAKSQLLRSLSEVQPASDITALEARILQEANALKIGVMGWGHGPTLLGCKIGLLDRIAPSFFVSIAYNCWALRRQTFILNNSGAILRWEDTNEGLPATIKDKRRMQIDNIKVLKTPLTKDQVCSLKVGDWVSLSGEIFTGRDRLHKYLCKHDSDIPLHESILYHTGPVVAYNDSELRITSAGPTTSMRVEPYQAEVIKRYNLRAIIGKGGMGERTKKALARYGCVYLSAVGGAAPFYAEQIEEVLDHFLKEWGRTEAVWHLKVKDMLLLVTMDAHGNSLHDKIKARSLQQLSQTLSPSCL